jgi:predicted ribosome quality control (RQC) complex YloA/Tae2 family protein
MPVDCLFIQGLCAELNDRIAGSRIDKIYMPRRDQVIMNLRSDSGAQRLVISVGQYAAVWLTKEKYENPDVPHMFCMLLRKQLSSGRIISVSQPEHERIVEIRLTASDEMGDVSEKRLVC